MSGLLYTRFELLRSFRFPLILYYVIAGAQSNVHNFDGTGISAPLYYMVGLTSFGTMMATISSGARIANERQIGWTRQLRITPLRTAAYFRAKVLTGYTMASLTIVLLYVAGASLGVRLPARSWLEMTGLILVGLLPFTALGIMLGHMLNVDSLGPATGGIVSLLALLSGTWFPLGHAGFLHDVGQFLPSYWLVQAAHVGLHGHGWGSMGWIVMAGWTVVLTVLARAAYGRDPQRP
jgi:ABC-2 type transport system permease protein